VTTGHNCTARVAVAGGDRVRETHAFRDAADDNQGRDDYGGARGHRRDPLAVRRGTCSHWRSTWWTRMCT
jgi:hypothetical protein